MDERQPRRRSSDDIGTRLTIVEVEMRAIGRRMDEHVRASETLHRDQLLLIQKLDERADRTDVQFGRLLAILSVIVMLANIVGPVIARQWFSVP